MLKIINGIGLLFVGDSKMSALGIRAHIQRLGHHYLCPLALTGNTGNELAQWVAAVADDEQDLHVKSIGSSAKAQSLFVQ